MTANDNRSAVLTVAELAERWKCHRQSVMDKIQEREVTVFRDKRNGRWRYSFMTYRYGQSGYAPMFLIRPDPAICPRSASRRSISVARGKPRGHCCFYLVKVRVF